MESLPSGEDITSLSVEELLGLLNSPHSEIVDEVRRLIKGQFSSVSDRWLVHGLVDYFFLTNSKRIVDLLISAPEPHDRYLLEKISDGIKSGNRFHHISLLLYAVSRSPPPAWIHKQNIHHTISSILLILSPTHEPDISVLVSGVAVLVVLLATIPSTMYKHLSRIFDSFWVLVHWAPDKEKDRVLKPYLQVAVYSLFHRLYALYPCNFLSYMRRNTVGQAKKAWFLNTLRPMIDRVHLHPLLISETKETECSRNRWFGFDPINLMKNCSPISLNPFEGVGEGLYFGNSSSPRCAISLIPSEVGSQIHSSSETSFWSPECLQSPSSATTSIPHTPVYKYQILSNHSTGTGLAESPPETAIEATPETTPFTSPLPVLTNPRQEPKFIKPGAQTYSKINLTTALERLDDKRFCPPLSPTALERLDEKRYCPPLSPTALERLDEKRFSPTVNSKEMKCEQNLFIYDKLKQIQLEREESKSGGLQNEDTKPERIRKRKLGVSDQNTYDSFDAKKGQDLFLEDSEVKFDSSLEDKVESDADICNKEISGESQEFYDADDEGLGAPTEKSFTELVKNVKTQRLRFLSQCGPPPNISFSSNDAQCRSPTNEAANILPSLRRKSSSFPSLLCDSLYIIPKRDVTLSSLSLSPTRSLVETATQTEENPIINPYEQLLEVLSFSRPTESRFVKNTASVDQYLEYTDPNPSLELGWNTTTLLSGGDDGSKTELRALHSLIVLERYKREMHAERNRRLLSKIKRLHLLQEKDRGTLKEKNALTDEIKLMQNKLVKLQESNAMSDKLLEEMIDKRQFSDLRKSQERTSLQREHLRQMCVDAREENSLLTEEVDKYRADMNEMRRQLNVLCSQGTENVSLRHQVSDMNKKIVILGEIQNEMRNQMGNLRTTQRKSRNTQHVQEMNDLRHRTEQAEMKLRENSSSLDATMLRIQQLEYKLREKNDEILKHQQEMKTACLMWQEQCDALEKRNQELHSINITLEIKLHQLLRFRPEKDGENAATSRLVPPTGQEGFLAPINPEQFTPTLPTECGSSFITQTTDHSFHSLSTPIFRGNK